jgi:hypothetical protein
VSIRGPATCGSEVDGGGRNRHSLEQLVVCLTRPLARTSGCSQNWLLSARDRVEVMIVKLSFPGHEGERDLSQYTGNQDGEVEGVRFHINDGLLHADAWFIFEDVVPGDHQCEVPLDRVFYLGAETGWADDKFLGLRNLPFFSQFSSVFSMYPVGGVKSRFAAPFLPWMVNSSGPYFVPHDRDINFLQNLEYRPKSRLLSVICSTQSWTPGHRLRLAFVERLKQELGDDLHWFGSGIEQVGEKWDALHPYTRTIVLENRSTQGVYSEKILDPYLALSEPIYWGDPSISRVLPVPAANALNIMDIEGSILKVRDLLRKPLNSESVDLLVAGRDKVADELLFLKRIVLILRNYGGESRTPKQLVSLSPRGNFGEGGSKKSTNTVARILAKTSARIRGISESSL